MSGNLAEQAERAARVIHKDDVYGNVEMLPYTVHLADVADNVTGEFNKAVAWLHDVLEDHPEIGFSGLIDEYNIPVNVVYVVEILTRRPGEEYEQYIIRVSKDSNAIPIKIADLLSNLRAQPSKRLVRRYAKALTVLTSKVIPGL